MSDQKTTPSSEDVERYLQQHPDFFSGKDDLLVEMNIRHSAGQAVSLVEKQLGILRERNTELRNRLGQLIDNARSNDRLFSHSRKLVLSLLDCKNTAQAVDVIYSSFSQDFGIETTQILLFDNNTISRARNESLINADREIGRYLKARQTIGGGLSKEEIGFVFGDKANTVQSAALAVLAYREVYGVIAIGNEDPKFYNSEMGTLFLNYIAEVASRVLRELQNKKPD
jgi:uncharacterized protein YigA (DUF484 family)